ncbi:sensor histidine kinase [Sphingomonas sp. PAMC 26617]|uniref:sensor histidine kinase n=1 Tax=Sphingomonas sp. PAMC 26617 TaxID=1112216 RepID=UPI000289A17A|nr:HWE histidine kinase domain-containing protein [Sphingomonas sp. PAMC 26617]
MQGLAKAGFGFSEYKWLEGIVAGVLKTSTAIQVDRDDLWALLNSLPVAILISTDRDCSKIIGNLSAQAMLQVPLGSNVSQSAPKGELPSFRVYCNDVPVPIENLPMQRAAATGQPVGHSECEIRFDTGRSIYIAGHCIPILNDSGEVCGALGAFIDVTEQRQTSERSAIVALEMAHRVKNSVSIIQSLAYGTIRKQLDPADYAVFEQRLINIARAQELIGKDYGTSADLRDLVLAVVEGVVQRDVGRVKWDGPTVKVDADVSVSLSMVLHELATNACKYGALQHDDGSVDVTWTCSRFGDCDRIRLVWQESGAFLRATPPKPGFGTKLIRNVMKAMPGGSVTSEYLPGGLSMVLTFTVQSERARAGTA